MKPIIELLTASGEPSPMRFYYNHTFVNGQATLSLCGEGIQAYLNHPKTLPGDIRVEARKTKRKPRGNFRLVKVIGGWLHFGKDRIIMHDRIIDYIREHNLGDRFYVRITRAKHPNPIHSLDLTAPDRRLYDMDFYGLGEEWLICVASVRKILDIEPGKDPHKLKVEACITRPASEGWRLVEVMPPVNNGLPSTRIRVGGDEFILHTILRLAIQRRKLGDKFWVRLTPQ